VIEAVTKTYDLDDPEGATAFLRDLVSTGAASGLTAKAITTTLGYVTDLELAIGDATALLMEDVDLEVEPDEEPEDLSPLECTPDGAELVRAALRAATPLGQKASDRCARCGLARGFHGPVLAQAGDPQCDGFVEAAAPRGES
jgi:hypothetical protein